LARSLGAQVLKVGFTGHQSRPGLDWAWVESALTDSIAALRQPVHGYTSLAAGSDQIFAERVLASGGEITAVIPFAEYAGTFSGSDLGRYNSLLETAKEVKVLNGSFVHQERSYYEAGLFAVDQAEIVFAVWDGNASAGLGGTADIVAYAARIGKSVVHFDITSNSVKMIGNPT
jgi:hypothetical protein